MRIWSDMFFFLTACVWLKNTNRWKVTWSASVVRTVYMNRSEAPLFIWTCFAFCECTAVLHVSCRVQTMCPLFVVGQQLFHSTTSKVDSAGCSWMWKESKHSVHLSSHSFIGTQSYHCHLLNDLCLVFYWAHFNLKFGWIWFYWRRSVIKIKHKFYTLYLLLSFF